MLDENAMREKFESWARSLPYTTDRTLERDEAGYYKSSVMQGMWSGWYSATASADADRVRAEEEEMAERASLARFQAQFDDGDEE